MNANASPCAVRSVCLLVESKFERVLVLLNLELLARWQGDVAVNFGGVESAGHGLQPVSNIL